MIGQAPICVYCLRRNDALTCEAFPAGIPEEILVNDADHRDPYEGDQGLQFQPDPGHPLPEWNDPFNPLMAA